MRLGDVAAALRHIPLLGINFGHFLHLIKEMFAQHLKKNARYVRYEEGTLGAGLRQHVALRGLVVIHHSTL